MPIPENWNVPTKDKQGYDGGYRELTKIPSRNYDATVNFYTKMGLQFETKPDDGLAYLVAELRRGKYLAIRRCYDPNLPDVCDFSLRVDVAKIEATLASIGLEAIIRSTVMPPNFMIVVRSATIVDPNGVKVMLVETEHLMPR